MLTTWAGSECVRGAEGVSKGWGAAVGCHTNHTHVRVRAQSIKMRLTFLVGLEACKHR